jgi:hypothetical protein
LLCALEPTRTQFGTGVRKRDRQRRQPKLNPEEHDTETENRKSKLKTRESKFESAKPEVRSFSSDRQVVS